jgi:pimeloyl-ACP methyl ester carboxylesterase
MWPRQSYPVPITDTALRAARRLLALQGIASRRLPTRVADLHYYEAEGTGTLPTVLVLHGIGSSATAFAGVVKALRPHARRVIAPDSPGHGFSGAPTVPLSPQVLFAGMRELVDRLITEPCVVFGSSLGGAIALKIAMEKRPLVRGVVVSSPGGARMDERGLADLVRVFDVSTSADARAFVRRLYHRPPWYTPVIAPGIKTLLARKAVRDFFASATAEDTLAPDALRDIDVPLLLLWGRSERLLPPEHLAFFRKNLPPHAIIEEPEGFGHCPQLERPRELAERIARFAGTLEKCAPSSAS